MGFVQRRDFLVAAGAVFAASLTAEAQQADKIARIGYLNPNSTATNPRLLDAFRQGMRDLGYVEGGNLVIEHRSADGKPERLPALAAELVALKADVIVSGGGTLAASAAQQATSTLPIVIVAVGDPVTSGLVASLARPGANVTGFSLLFPDLVGKGLELLKQAVPGINRVAVLVQPGAVPERSERDIQKEAEVAALKLGLQLQVVEARGAGDFDSAFSLMSSTRVHALTVLSTPVFLSARKRLVELATKNKLPTVFSFREYVEAGGLMSYGPDLANMYRRSATYVDRILKGTKPGELPVEQPTKFELMVNLRTAEQLGVTIPTAVLARADAVIR